MNNSYSRFLLLIDVSYNILSETTSAKTDLHPVWHDDLEKIDFKTFTTR